MIYTGGCHCGNVRFEVDANIDHVLECNCSICQKKGHLLTFVPEHRFTLKKGHHDLNDYQFNTKKIHHLFCKNCGVSSFGHGTGPNGAKMMSINVRCLDNIELAKFPVFKYNGRDL